MNFLIYGFLITILFYNLNKYFYRFILYLLGFSVETDNFDKLSDRIMIISTHTSIYDFFIGTFLYYGYFHKKYDNYILMKKSYENYTSPFVGLLDNKIKFIEVNNSKNGLVKKIIEEIQYKDNYMIYLSPEGTRQFTDKLKSGYWVIAKELNLDVCYLGIDFYQKVIKFENSRKVENYWDDEINVFTKYASEYKPLFPENCYFYLKDKID